METIVKYIKENVCDPWAGTIFEGYKFLNNKQKGMVGEIYTSELMKSLNHKVLPASSSGHDRIIDEIKTEIKFSLGITDSKTQKIKDNSFMLNHVSKGKDWDRLIFVGINKNLNQIAKFMTRENFILCLNETNYFSFQQGGATVENDDYMCTGTKLITLLNSKYMEDISNWN
ncbi:MAG: hypothetical protein M0R38_11435 [Bacteroidia bacterium]|nr:hypothetical protein [Bacteroidia bacterium]